MRLKDPSPEFKLLLLSCHFTDRKAAVVAASKVIELHRIKWEDLIDQAVFHRLEPQLSDLLDKLSPHSVAPGIREKLKELVQANLVGQIRYVCEFLRIREWLGEENITVVPYKGFWLGESMYGNLGNRVSSDIDLFIDLSDLEKVKQIMISKGYSGHRGLDQLTDEYIHEEVAEYNFDRFEDGVCQVHVEFHWRSAMNFYRMGITLDDLRPQITRGILQGSEIEVLSPAADLLLVVMHHGGKECYSQLRQILDIAHILRKNPVLDTEWLFHQAERYHVITLLILGVRLAHELTGVEVPAAFANRLANRRIDNMASGRHRLMAKSVDELEAYKNNLSSWVFKIHSRDGMGIKYHLLKHMLRKIVAPILVPERWRHHFFNSKIRRR